MEFISNQKFETKNKHFLNDQQHCFCFQTFWDDSPPPKLFTQTPRLEVDSSTAFNFLGLHVARQRLGAMNFARWMGIKRMSDWGEKLRRHMSRGKWHGLRDFFFFLGGGGGGGVDGPGVVAIVFFCLTKGLFLWG